MSVVPLGPRGGAPTELRGMRGRGSGVPADLFVRRAYRFVDRLLIGTRNGMVGDSNQTRGVVPVREVESILEDLVEGVIGRIIDC